MKFTFDRRSFLGGIAGLAAALATGPSFPQRVENTALPPGAPPVPTGPDPEGSYITIIGDSGGGRPWKKIVPVTNLRRTEFGLEGSVSVPIHESVRITAAHMKTPTHESVRAAEFPHPYHCINGDTFCVNYRVRLT